jgi:putative sterol carrier protein
MSVVRPPQDITPARFFEEWLPAQAAALNVKPSRDVRVRIELSGDDGGVWELAVTSSGLTAARGNGATGQADITIRQTVPDWRAVVAGEPGGVSLAPSGGSPTDLLFVDRAAQQVLSTVRGQMLFEVTGFNGRTWQATVAFGQGSAKDKPDATITVDADTYSQMLARTLPAPQAYFQGKIRISGDANLAMQLGMAMMSRYS